MLRIKKETDELEYLKGIAKTLKPNKFFIAFKMLSYQQMYRVHIKVIIPYNLI